MPTEVDRDVKCECGRLLAHRKLEPGSLMISNHLHKQTLMMTTAGISLRGRCPGCSKLHTLQYSVDLKTT